MQDTQEKNDVPSETRADSARVGSKYEKLDSNATKAAFNELRSVLDGLAKQVILTIDQLIPHLADMQSLLSQRGKARKKVLKDAGLPSWTEYGKAYADKLECSFRKIQDHITGLRRNGKSGPSQSAKNGQNGKGTGRRSKPWHADAKDSRALADAQLAINEFVAAYEVGADMAPAYQQYKRTAVSPTKLVSILDATDGGSSKVDVETEVKRKLVPVVKTAERYVKFLEELINSQPVSLPEDKQKMQRNLKEEWRSILRYARGVEVERKGKGMSTEAVPAALKEAA